MQQQTTPPAEGMKVFAPNGDPLGNVKSVGTNDVLISRQLQPSVRVPLTAIQSVAADRVTLNIGADELDELYWVHAGEDIDLPLKNVYD